MSFGGASDIRSRMSRFETNKSSSVKPALVTKTKPVEKTNGETETKKEEEPAPAPAPAKTKKKFEMPKREKCRVCNISVYEMEKLVADEMVYHKTCFRCKKCRNTLRVGNYASLDGQVFCKPHFKELFKLKGNYEEGFGKQRHKNKWLQKQGSTDSQPNSRHGSKQGTPEPISSSSTHNSRKHSLPESNQPARQRPHLDEEEKENEPSVKDVGKPASKQDQNKGGVASRYKPFNTEKNQPPPKPKPKPAEPLVDQPTEDAGDGDQQMEVEESDSGVVTTDPIQVGNMKARFEMEMKRAAAGGAPMTEARRDIEAMRGGRGAMKSRYEEALAGNTEIGQGDRADEEEDAPKPRANMQNLLSRFKAIESGEKKAGHVVISDDEEEGDGEKETGNTSIRDELKTMKKASKFRSFFETVSQTGEGGRYSEDEDEEQMEVDNQK